MPDLQLLVNQDLRSADISGIDEGKANILEGFS
jgi:hypothetical protein